MSQPFSHVYCVPDSAQRDSQRLRYRLGRYASAVQDPGLLIDRIEIETGARVPWNGAQRSLDMFFQQAETRDVLDAITHIYSAWTDRARVRERFVQDAYALHQAAAAWRNFVRRVLAEEHTTYEVDDECNVRYAIDEAYALNRKATLSGLQDPRWDASRAEFERAFAAMDGTVQDTNGSVRAMAAAVESCAKVMIGNGIARVGPAEIERYLWPMVGELYQNDQVAADASHQILKSLADWVNATHQYRHGQDAGTEVRVPLELAIQFLTLGAGFLRWLIDMDVHRAARS